MDSETSAVVPRENTAGGYEAGKGQYLIVEDEELAGAAMSQDKSGRVADEQAPLEISQTLEERLTTIGRIVRRFSMGE